VLITPPATVILAFRMQTPPLSFVYAIEVHNSGCYRLYQSLQNPRSCHVPERRTFIQDCGSRVLSAHTVQKKKDGKTFHPRRRSPPQTVYGRVTQSKKTIYRSTCLLHRTYEMHSTLVSLLHCLRQKDGETVSLCPLAQSRPCGNSLQYPMTHAT
jgi:hypothetical protein